MRKHKRVIAQFTFHDRTGISCYLEKMALRGWMLDKITKFFWHFRPVEPRRIHFAVSYFSKTSSFEPQAPESLLHFREFCEHSGWKFCAEAAQMQIFYNEAENPIPIETDALLEIESIHKGMKKQQLPCYILFLVAALLNGLPRIYDLIKNPLAFYKTNLSLFAIFGAVIVFIIGAAELGSYFIWRSRALKAARRDGSFIPTRGNRVLMFILLYLLIAAFLLFILAERNSFISAALLICMGYYFAIVILVHGISALMKRKKVDAGTNVTVTIIFCVILSFAMIGILTWTVSKLHEADFFEAKAENFVLAPEEEYEYENFNYTFYHHALPLYAEDIYDTDIGFNGPLYSNYREHQESIAMSFDRCHATLRRNIVGSDLPDLYYSIIDVKLCFLTERIFQDALDEKDYAIFDGRYEYRPVDAGLWKADEVYQEFGTDYMGGSKQPMDNYLIRWGDRIVVLNLKEPPTEEQIAVIAGKLGT